MGFWNLGESKKVKARKARKARVKNEVDRQFEIHESKKKADLYRAQADMYEQRNRKKRAASGGRSSLPWGETTYGKARHVARRAVGVSHRRSRWF